MTNKITGVSVGVALVLLGALGLAMPANAAVVITHLTVNNATNVTVEEGDVVEAGVTYTATNSTDAESYSWELVGSGLPKTCVDTVDTITNSTFTRSFDIDMTGASEGTWDVKISAYGDDGPNVSNLCEVGDQIDSMTFGDRITVTDQINDNQSGGNDTGTGGTTNSLSKSTFCSWFPQWCNTNAPTAPTVSSNATKCNTVSPFLSAPKLAYSSTGVQLQSALLLDNPNSIPALAAGATIPMGYRGPQTTAALQNFSNQYGCGFMGIAL